MEYTIRKLARMAGVSTRTLRYYHEIGLLDPERISSTGYRIYGSSQVNRLQIILFYRELGLELETIRSLLDSPDFDRSLALSGHREKLLEKRRQLDILIRNVERSIEEEKGGDAMSDREKFEGFKKQMVEENERKFGKEIREKYGEEAVEKSNRTLLGMTPEQYEKFTSLEAQILSALEEAVESGDPAGEAAQRAAGLHRQWLRMSWGSCSPEAHLGVARMYVEDERFIAYYDRNRPGCARMLLAAVEQMITE